MRYRVSFQFWGQDDACESQMRAGLSSTGIELTSLENSNAEAYAVIGFAQIESGLIALLHSFRRRAYPRVLALAANGSSLENGGTWRLLHAGAADVAQWNGESTAQQILDKVERCHILEQATSEALQKEPVAGESSAWRNLVRRVVEAGRFSRTPVLLTGDSGTGKEHLARLVHAVLPEEDALREGGRREDAKRADLVTVDCTTIVPDLSGSELFGHEKGAFTGAHSVRDGAFALANDGTLFLDEVGELSLPLQAQLLRAIQEKTYKRVGGNVWLRTNFRLVCATNRDLDDLVRRGQFRLDLYHRIAGWVFRTLRLEERREDILPLANYFLSTIFLREQPDIDNAVCEYLLNRAYPGNIRELRQLMERIAHRHAGQGPITVGDIPEEDRPSDNHVERAWPDERLERTIADAIALGASLREISSATTAAAIRIAVQSERGNLQRAAKRLGVTDRALQMRRAAGMLPDV